MQKITCSKGHCEEVGTIENELDTIYTNNPSDQIELHLLKKMVR